MKFVSCTLEAHGAAILDIFNEQILTSTAVYEYQPRVAESMVVWFKTKVDKGYPIIGIRSTFTRIIAARGWARS
jgi:L-amino acid N-acyltransferase YncA